MKTKNILAAAVLSLIGSAAYSQVVVNEFSATNDTLLIQGQESDWIEVYNAGSSDVNLKGYSVSDNPKNPQKYTIDVDMVIYPGNYKIILCNGLGQGANTNFKLSGDGSEHVVWSDSKGNVIDDISIPKMWRDRSYGRVNDGGNTWGIFDVATPLSSNNVSQAKPMAPVLSVKSGFYTSKQNVSISCSEPGAVIRYTLDGSMPTSKSKEYTGAIAISSTKVLRAAAFVDGMAPSEAATATYFINSRQITIPVVSLSTDDDYFYDPKIGFYVDGDGTRGVVHPASGGRKVNWNTDWEYPVHIEYFDVNKKLVLSQDAGIKITGTYSRSNAMKSLRVIARKRYGDNRLRYKFFDKKDITEFKSIVLRNGSNDFGGTMLRDALVSGLAGDKLDIDVQGYQPAAVFLNGQYLGLHNIREKVATHFVEENYGAEANDIDLLENNGSVIDGVNTDYKSLLNFANSNSMSVDANYNKVAAQMDINNYIDYWCAEIYIDNMDWPNNNIKYYKTHGTNSKWRWIMFGAEYSTGVYGSGPDEYSIHHGIDPNTGRQGSSQWGGELMRQLLKNEGFKNQFIQRMSYTIDHVYNYQRVSNFLDSLVAQVENEHPYHDKKWYPDWYNWRNNLNNLYDWMYRRPELARKHLHDYFKLGAAYDVDVTADCNGAKFSINGARATADVSGKFFNGTTLKLTAKLPEGREFDHWEVSGMKGQTVQVFAYGANWKFFDKGRLPSWDWYSNANASSSWQSGNSPLGYPASSRPATNISYGPDANNKYPTTYFTKTVSLQYEPSSILSASITLKVDDGAVIYVNGKEQGRIQMNDGQVSYNSWSSTYYADISELPENTINIDPSVFQKGNNLIAVEVHQTSASSSDLWMDAKMEISVTSQGSTADKIYDHEVSINPASNTMVKLITKQAADSKCEERTASVKGSIFINEVSVRNNGNLSDDINHYPSWVEFYNKSNTPIDMAGLYIMDDAIEYKIPCNQKELTTVPANGRLIFYLDGLTNINAQHIGLTLKTDKENHLYLGEKVNGQSAYVDWVTIPEMKKGYSYGRKTDGASDFVVFSQTTPYLANNKGTVSPNSPIFTPVHDVESITPLKVLAYPNPTSDFVYLVADSMSTGEFTYSLYNMQGKLMKTGNGDKVDLQSLPMAVYLLRVKVGDFVTTVKVLKK